MNSPLDLDLNLSDVTVRVPADPSLPVRKLLTPVPEEPHSYYLTIDNSSLEQFNVCARSAEYYMVHSRESSNPSPALVFGGALHKGLESLYKYGNKPEIEPIVNEQITQHFFKNPPPPDEYRTASLCLDIFGAYKAAHPVELFQIVEDAQGPWIERSFRLPLGVLEIDQDILYSPEALIAGDYTKMSWSPTLAKGGFHINKIYILWTGRIDLVIQWDGKLWVLDHKTTSRGGETFYDDFYLAQQTIGYTWAAQQLLDKPVAGLVLNAFEVRAPTKTGKGPTFNRRRYEYSPEQLVEWEHNTRTLVGDFLHHLARGYFPMETKWCHGKYGKCKYFDVCRLPAAQRATALAFDSFRDVTWSPENNTD